MGTENLPFSFPIAGLDRTLELTAGVTVMMGLSGRRT
jgi:hypothetical protein